MTDYNSEENNVLNNDQKDGLWVTYHDDNLRVKSESQYYNGKLDGVYREWYNGDDKHLRCGGFLP